MEPIKIIFQSEVIAYIREENAARNVILTSIFLLPYLSVMYPPKIFEKAKVKVKVNEINEMINGDAPNSF